MRPCCASSECPSAVCVGCKRSKQRSSSKAEARGDAGKRVDETTIQDKTFNNTKSASGLVVKSIVAIDGPRVRFAAGAILLSVFFRLHVLHVPPPSCVTGARFFLSLHLMMSQAVSFFLCLLKNSGGLCLGTTIVSVCQIKSAILNQLAGSKHLPVGPTTSYVAAKNGKLPALRAGAKPGSWKSRESSVCTSMCQSLQVNAEPFS